MPVGVSAYVPLANLTVAVTAASVTFSSISGSYRDLVLVVQSSLTLGAAQVFYRFNGDTGSNYSAITMQGNGSSATSNTNTAGQFVASTSLNDATTGVSNAVLNIMDYTATDKHKTSLLRTDNAAVGTIATAVRWANTSAITSILVSPSASTFVAGSSFSLYGIAS